MTGLKDARLYLVARARIGDRRMAELVGELISAGVDVVQLREKEMEAADVIREAEPILGACRQAGIPFFVNDRPDIALAIGAGGVHLGQNDLPIEIARRVCPEALFGLSSHAPAEIDHILELDPPPDYFAAGPVYETPTKPGRPSAGLDLIRYAAGKRTAIPWFAIGGIDEETLPEVLDAGARRIVVVRAITEAPDPPAAAAALRTLLDGVPL